ncbi:hypothetical protein N0V90_007124 [Kalmusia sp. IMI 367209]|nr:hypothetical protein N0V90_007124 [Kalmusia sp. IMI 367209]
MEQTIHEITGIAVDALRGTKSLSDFSSDERFKWAANRITKREEDEAYCLLGIFDIQMPLLYGEKRERAMRRLKKEIGELSNSTVQSPSAEQKQLLLSSLKFEQIDARQMSIKSAHAKTCKWLLRKTEYLDWLDTAKLSEHHGFLWIKGKPGTGKSTLMKFALANARKKKDYIVISFFFHARGEDLEKSTTGTYRSLLLQLLERLPNLQGLFDSLGLSALNASSEYQWSIESLKTLLEQAILNLGESSVICFIDALDECAEDQIRDMISFFEHVGELIVSSGIRFQVCFSSRHYPHITIKKGLDLVLEGQEGHMQDITNYLESELKIGQSKIAQQVRSELQEKASGIFMWVVLVTGILNKEHDRGRIHALRRRLHEIPADLYELFRDILTRDSHNRDELVLSIQWVLFAKQPLSPEQLYFAILSGVEKDAVSMWDSKNITRDVIKKFILDCSKGLTEITKTKLERIQFIHESVREFLLKEDGLQKILSDLSNNLQGQSHERLKECCLDYMSVDVFTPLDIPEPLPRASSPQAADLRKLVNNAYPFLEYAIKNVLYHADAAERCGVRQADFLESFPLSRWVRLDNLFERHQIRRHSEDVSLLYLLGEHNMPNLIEARPHLSSCVEVEEERYGCPIFAAMATGSKEALQVMLRGLVSEQAPENQLCEVASRDFYEECNQKSITRDFTFSKNQTVFTYAAQYGYKRIVASLLEIYKSDINLTDASGRTPLSWAAQGGHRSVVELLLGTQNVDVNVKDDEEMTLLSNASAHGHDAIVQLLLDSGKADIESRDRHDQTPLSHASMNGHKAVVQLLLDSGKVGIESRDKLNQTPLFHAAGMGHEAVVQLLLDSGKVDIGSRNKLNQTPLSHAAQMGHKAVVQLLLDSGKVDIESRDNSNRTPLSHAAGMGHEAVVQLLLDSGKVDIGSRNKLNQTPLYYAARMGREAVVQLLLDSGKVDIESRDIYNQTPLSCAAGMGHEAVVQLLLDSGKVDIESRDIYNQTPLSRAAENGHRAVVQLLLDSGRADVGYTGKVDLTAKDRVGKTALDYAVERDQEEIVRLLQARKRLALT